MGKKKTKKSSKSNDERDLAQLFVNGLVEGSVDDKILSGFHEYIQYFEEIKIFVPKKFMKKYFSHSDGLLLFYDDLKKSVDYFRELDKKRETDKFIRDTPKFYQEIFEIFLKMREKIVESYYIREFENDLATIQLLCNKHRLEVSLLIEAIATQREIEINPQIKQNTKTSLDHFLCNPD